MKIAHSVEGTTARVEVSGDLDATQCNCLEAFWHCHIPDGLTGLDLDLRDLDVADGESIAILVNIVRAHLEHETRVTILHAPQMLAHTFYKTGMLAMPALTLMHPREEEPYG